MLRPCIIRQTMIIFSQHLHSKILHGGTLLQLYQTHLECESTLVEIMSFRPRNRVKTKKRSSPRFGTKFSRSFWDLFVLTGPFLSDQPALKSRWEDAKGVGGTLTIDGETRSPYNLSTVSRVLGASEQAAN